MSEDRLMELARAAGYAFASEDELPDGAAARPGLPRDVLFQSLRQEDEAPVPSPTLFQRALATVPVWAAGRA